MSTRSPGVPATKPATTHQHHCPTCGCDFRCTSAAGTPCANQVANGNVSRLCDLCWGMERPAREGGTR